MKRRRFSTGLLAAGLAAPPVLGPASAVANVLKDDDLPFERFARLKLTLPGQVVPITWVLLLYASLLGLSFSRTIPRYLLQRAALGVLGLQRPPFGSRFKNSVLLGNVILWSNMLLILPLLRNRPAPKKFTVAHGDFEYAHPGTPKPVKLRGLPDSKTLQRQPVIGTARINDDGELGLFIPPMKIKYSF